MRTRNFNPIIDVMGAEISKLILNGHRLKNPHGTPLPRGMVCCPPELYDKMNACWLPDPKQRPTFASLKDFLSFFRIPLEDAQG